MARQNRAGTTLPQRVLRNVGWNFFGEIWLLVIAFFATPFIVRTLKPDLYGIYALIFVIIGYFSFLQFGLGTASVKYIAQYMAVDDRKNVKRVFWSCLLAYIFIGSGGTMIIASASRGLVSRFFRIGPEYSELAIFCIRVGSLGFVISIITAAVCSMLRAAERFDILNGVSILFRTIQISAVIIILRLGFSLREVVVSTVLVQAAALLVFFCITFLVFPFLKSPLLDGNALLKLLKFGGFITVSSIVNPILQNVEKIFLTAAGSLSSLTYYYVPYNLTAKFQIAPAALSGAIFPTFSNFQSSRNDAANRQLHYRSTLYLALFSAFFAAFIAFFGQDFLRVWIGGDFADRSSGILTILVLAGFVNSTAWPSLTALQGLGRPHIPAIFHAAELILYIPMAYIFILRWGGVGAAASWLIRVIADALLLHIASTRLLKESIVYFYAKLLSRTLPAVLLAAASFMLLKSRALPFLGAANIAALAAITAVYFAAVWAWGFDATMRRAVRVFFIR